MSKNLIFCRVGIRNWKNFVNAEVAVQNRTFLVGPNASGKSNFLDVFRFLRDLASPGGGLQESIGRRGGVTALRCLAARRYSDVGLVVELKDAGDASKWEYEILFNQDKQRRPILRKERVICNGALLLDRPNGEDREDEARLSQTYLEQVNVNRPFRDLTTFFSSIRYLHIVPQLVREPDRSVGRSDDPFGGDFLEQIAKIPEKTRNARMRRIKDALQVAVPQFQEIELDRDTRGTPHLRGKFQHWRPQGAWQTEEQLSDGTLRLMGLLWAAMEGSGPHFLRLPNALSALYPTGSEEKRLLDAMLLAVPR